MGSPFPSLQKADTEQPKIYSGQRAANNGNSGEQHISHTGPESGLYQESTTPAPPPNTRAGRARAEAAPRAALGRDPGGPGAAAHSLVPALAAPIEAPRAEGHEEVVQGIGWGGGLHQDGDTKREGKFAAVAG